jgi:hypothetical protein
MRTDGVFVALAVLATAGCATLPPCPARGGPAWTEWTSPHVVLETDLDEPDARAALHDLEELRSAVLIAAWRRMPEPRQRVTVVAFRTDAERRMFVPAGFDAAIVAAGAGQVFLVRSGAERDETVTHGLVRALAHELGLAGKALWFDEGLARYLEHLRIEDDRTMRYGDVDPVLYRNVTRGRLTSFENLWTAPTAATRASFMATSWLAVHYLFNREPERFLAFQRALLTTDDARAAWNQAFPGLSFAAMDDRLAAYAFQGGTFAAFETRLPQVATEAEAAPLADAQVHALRALLFATIEPRRPDRARDEIAEARRADPADVTAAYVERVTLGDAPTDVELPKRLIDKHPSNPIAWFLLARAQARRHENAEARESWEEFRRFGGEPDLAVPIELRIARPD